MGYQLENPNTVGMPDPKSTFNLLIDALAKNNAVSIVEKQQLKPVNEIKENILMLYQKTGNYKSPFNSNTYFPPVNSPSDNNRDNGSGSSSNSRGC